MYKDDHGEMVTDLAYQTDFTDMVSGQHAKLQEQFAKGSLDFDVTMAEDFKPAGTDGLQFYKRDCLTNTSYYDFMYTVPAMIC